MKTSLHLLLLGCLLQPFAALAQTYCQPTYAGTTIDYINGFVMGGIDNQGSGPTVPSGYTDYTNTGPNSITTVAPGSTYTATAFLSPSPDSHQYAIWVDLDGDHAFAPDERLAHESILGTPVSLDLSITIPADAKRGYTRLRVMCTFVDDPNDACGSYMGGETEDYNLVIDDGAPCIPVYYFGTSEGDYIDGIQFGTINNTGSGGTGNQAYSTLMNHLASVAPGNSYPMTITAGARNGDVYSVWVDLDQDGSFQPSEKLVLGVNSVPGETLVLNVVIPANAVTGYTRMRVMCTFLVDPTDACGPFFYGEAEDYTLVIDDGAPCIPVYSYGTIQGDYIDGVIFGDIANTGSGGSGSAAYTDLVHAGPGHITSVAPGVSYPMTITSGASDLDRYSVWVDLDQDGAFQLWEKLAVAVNSVPGETLVLNVAIPANALTGYTRMRVMCTWAVDPTSACGPEAFGETEDYTLVIDDGAPCIPLYGGQASQGHFISEVQLADLAWGPIQVLPTGYTDALHNGAHLQAGATSTLTIFGGSASSGTISAWIDWGVGFELAGSLPVGTAFSQVSFDITPASNYVGYARMRLTHTDAPVGPCDASAFGHAVDFTLSVGSGGWPCLPLQGYGTQFGDGFTDLTIEGDGYSVPTQFPYYAASSSVAYHYDAGGSITISFTAGQYAPETYRLSMDMNDNGNFFDTNEEPLIYTSASAGELITMTYQLPPNCLPGQHFVRLRANDEANDPLSYPCEDSNYGQIFDWVVVVEDPNGPCIPFMQFWTIEGDFIDGVQLGTIQNTGTGSAFGAAYQDYTAQSTTLIVGQPATLTITGGEYAGDTYSAWIDYNNDNDFDDAGESLGWIGIVDPYGTNDLPFTVPPGTTLGSKRMRVRCATIGMSDACLDNDFGETEDYTVHIEVNTGVMAATTADLRLLPTTDGVQLLTDASLIGHAYTLFDATGRTMTTGRITADRTDLPMLDFAHGAYTVQVTNGDARQVKRFVW